ncbi:MAG: serine/threonine-protein kinase [Methanoregula sp.]|nr:serine/threonine-protein kinase [Methanoregula sp.]
MTGNRTCVHLLQILLIAGIFSFLSAHVCADTLTLFDKMPKYNNGENSILLQARNGNTYTDLLYLPDVGDYWFGTTSTFRHKPSITRGVLPGNNPYDKLAIHAFPSAVIQTGFKADSVIRVTIPGNGKFVKISGQTGFEGKSTVSHYRFYIYKGADQFNSPLWESGGGDNFNFNVPYSANDQLFFAVEALDSDDEMGPKWKSVVLETYTDQPPAGNSGSTTAVATPMSTLSPQMNATGFPTTGSTNGGGDNFALYGIIGIFVVLLAGGGFFVLKRKSAPSAVLQPATPPDVPSGVQGVSIPAQMPAPPDSSTSLPNELLSQYDEIKYIGQGGFAKIFSAKRKDGVAVAIKVPLSMNPATGKSFITELQNWTHLDHENIVRIYDYNVIPVPYFEMELCDNSLAETKLPIAPANAAWLLFQICEGLKYAHSRNIVHRDLKPQNILMKNGIPKLSDWGLSRFLAESKISTTQPSFTPYYAAPEQISGKQKDNRTDIWQLGVIFYELVTGKLPFTGDSMVEVMSGIVTKNPAPPSQQCPAAHDFEPVIMKCLKKDPKERYQSVIELQRALAANLKMNYTDSLKKSVSENDFKRSAYYCGDLLMVNMKIGDLVGAHKYACDLAHYAQGDIKVQAAELAEQIQIRLEMNIPEIPDELIMKADMIVHQVNFKFEK